MAYSIKRVAQGKKVVLPRRLYFTDDRKTIVEHGDPKCAFLLGAKGREMSAKQAKDLGVDDYLKKTGKGAEPKANKRKAKVENK